MDYKEFIENYSFKLQLLDALDSLSNLSIAVAEIVDPLASCSSNEKTASLLLQTDQKM